MYNRRKVLWLDHNGNYVFGFNYRKDVMYSRQKVLRLDHNGDYVFGFDNKKDVKTRYVIASIHRRQSEYERSRIRFHAFISAFREGFCESLRSECDEIGEDTRKTDPERALCDPAVPSVESVPAIVR